MQAQRDAEAHDPRDEELGEVSDGEPVPDALVEEAVPGPARLREDEHDHREASHRVDRGYLVGQEVEVALLFGLDPDALHHVELLLAAAPEAVAADAPENAPDRHVDHDENQRDLRVLRPQVFRESEGLVRPVHQQVQRVDALALEVQVLQHLHRRGGVRRVVDADGPRAVRAVLVVEQAGRVICRPP